MRRATTHRRAGAAMRGAPSRCVRCLVVLTCGGASACGTMRDDGPDAVADGGTQPATVTTSSVPSADAPADCLAERLDGADPTTITVAYPFAGTRQDAILGDLVERFETAHPEVQVTLRAEEDPVAFVERLTGAGDALAADVAVLSPAFFFDPLADAGTLSSLDGCLAATDFDLAPFDPQAVLDGRRNGHQIGIPVSLEGHVMLYDRAAFVAAGLDPDEPPTDGASLASTARALSDSGVPLPYVPEAPSLLLTASGVAPLEATGAAGLTAPAVTEVARLMRSLRQDGLLGDVDPGGHVLGADGGPDPMTALADGTVAMTTMAGWSAEDVSAATAAGEAPGVELGVARVPGLGGTSAVAVDAGHLAIPAAAPPERRAAAWTFVAWAARPEQQAALYAAGQFVPTRVDATVQPEVADLWARHPLVADTWRLLNAPDAAIIRGGPLGVGFGAFDAAVRDAGRDVETALASGNTDLAMQLAAFDDDPLGWWRCHFAHQCAS